MTLYTNTPEETEQAGADLAIRLTEAGCSSAFIALEGDLGVGKTAFARGFCRIFGILRVKSPTYTIVNEYKGDKTTVLHMDLYRLEDDPYGETIGLEEYLSRGLFILCEWSERLAELPEDALTVRIEKTDKEGERVITFLGKECLC